MLWRRLEFRGSTVIVFDDAFAGCQRIYFRLCVILAKVMDLVGIMMTRDLLRRSDEKIYEKNATIQSKHGSASNA